MPSAPAAEGDFTLAQHQGHVRVRLAGTPDLPAVEALRVALAGLVDSGKDVVVDCANAEHVSSAVLQVLVAAEAARGQEQQWLRIESESAAIRDYLRLAGLDERFPTGKAMPGSKRGTLAKRKRSSQVSPQP